MKILLSPAKALDLKKTINFSSFTSPFFIKEASLLIDKLKEYSPAQISNMMNVSINLGELKSMGYKPFVVGLIAAITVGIISLIYIETLIKFIY